MPVARYPDSNVLQHASQIRMKDAACLARHGRCTATAPYTIHVQRTQYTLHTTCRVAERTCERAELLPVAHGITQRSEELVALLNSGGLETDTAT